MPRLIEVQNPFDFEVLPLVRVSAFAETVRAFGGMGKAFDPVYTFGKYPWPEDLWVRDAVCLGLSELDMDSRPLVRDLAERGSELTFAGLWTAGRVHNFESQMKHSGWNAVFLFFEKEGDALATRLLL